MTVGSGSLKKTFNTNGNVTTTVGLPGTGIYWTDTERRGSRNNRSSASRQNRENIQAPQSEYQVSAAVNDYFSQPSMFEDDEPAPMTEFYSSNPVSTPNYSDIGEVVAILITDSAGVAEIDNLPWGRYLVTETKAPEHYETPTFSTEITITTNKQICELVVENEPTKGWLRLTKTDRLNGNPIAGVRFYIYNKNLQLVYIRKKEE